MEDEIIIFSRVIARDEFNDNYFISLTSDADTQLAAVSVSGINIKNVISTGTPIISMTFIDGHGDLVNVNRLDTEMDYYLYFGKSDDDVSRLPMKISRIDFENTDGGKSEQFSFTVFFVMSNWSSLIHEVHNRGWSDIKYSDVVEEIASESDFEEVDVSPSKNNQSFVVQPYWSNLSMLRDIRENAIPESTTGHYEFGVNLDNSFFFLSTEDLVQRAIDRFDGEGEVPLLKLQSHELNQAQRKEKEKENAGIPANFVKFLSSERFLDSVLQGAGGIESQYYDYDNRSFVRTKHPFSGSGEKTLSDWTYIHEDNEKSSLKFRNGRDPDVENTAMVRVSDVIMSTCMFKISTVGSINYEVGGVVELVIPVPPDKTNTQFNEMYSGFYWITEIEHNFDLRKGKGKFMTNLTLSRNGLDGKDLEGYVESPGGRII